MKKYAVKSMSDGRRNYTITRSEKDKFSCSCPAWIYRYPRTDCKHIKQLRSKLGLAQTREIKKREVYY